MTLPGVELRRNYISVFLGGGTRYFKKKGNRSRFLFSGNKSQRWLSGVVTSPHKASPRLISAYLQVDILWCGSSQQPATGVSQVCANRSFTPTGKTRTTGGTGAPARMLSKQPFGMRGARSGRAAGSASPTERRFPPPAPLSTLHPKT